MEQIKKYKGLRSCSEYIACLFHDLGFPICQMGTKSTSQSCREGQLNKHVTTIRARVHRGFS